MKNFTKSIVILIILFLNYYTTKAQTEYQLDSIQQFQYDESFIPLQMTQRTHYAYEIGGVKPTEVKYLNKELGLGWNILYKFNITYNSDNNILSDNTKIWDEANAIWLDSSKSEYEYDEFQNNTVITYYSYEGANWNFVHRRTQEFNENKQITYQLFEGVIPMTTEIFKNQNIYTYDENSNNTLIESQVWNSVTETWDDYQKSESTYVGNLIMQQDIFNWTGTWSVLPQSRQIYHYTSTDVYDITFQSDAGSGLINGSKIFYTYNGIWPLEIEFKQWDTNSNGWLEDSKYTYSYDSNDNISNVFNFIWDNSTYVLNGESRYFLSEAQPLLGVSIENLIGAKAFPNPFKSELNLTLPTILDFGATLQVFDAQGREVSNTTLRPGSKLIKLENSNLANGMYFFKVSSKSQSEIFKVIKE